MSKEKNKTFQAIFNNIENQEDTIYVSFEAGDQISAVEKAKTL